MKTLAFIIFIGLLSCTSNNKRDLSTERVKPDLETQELGSQGNDLDQLENIEDEKDKVQEAVAISDEIVKYVSDSLPEYFIPSKENYDPDLISFIEDIEHPYYCESDFDGNGEYDYGLILLSEGNTKASFYIINKFNGKFESFNISRLPMGMTSEGLAAIVSIEEKGSWTSFDTTMYMPNGGISLELLEESRTRFYYWDGTQYTRFFTD